MKRVTTFVKSARKKHTYDAVHQFLDNLQLLHRSRTDDGEGKTKD